MARIGIMTFLHNDNYGSILQAWALQNAVRSLGYDAEHIDYVPSQTEKMKNLLCSGNSPRLILDGMKKRSAARGLNEGFDEFRQTQMILSPICRDQSALAHQALSYDALICGSDQIWSPTWRNPAYFLNFTKKPKVAYAPSLGVSTMTDSAKGRKIAALIRGFAAISVREEEGAALLQSLIGKKPYRKRDHAFCHREHSMKLIRSVRLLICLKYKSVVFYYNQTVKRYLSFMKPSDKFCNSLFRQPDSLRLRFF